MERQFGLHRAEYRTAYLGNVKRGKKLGEVETPKQGSHVAHSKDKEFLVVVVGGGELGKASKWEVPNVFTTWECGLL